YQSLLKMCMPVVRGPENRHGFASFEEKNSNSFLKFNPFTSPVEPNYPFFPHRDDVPLVDTCSVDYSDWKPHQQVPITGKRGQSAHRRQMILLEETSQDRKWSSRAVSDASVRARLRDWRTPVKHASALPDQNYIFAFCVEPNLKAGVWCSSRWREEIAGDYFYKSNTQRAYEEVPWDNPLPSKIQSPESTVELLADPVSQCLTKRRYYPEPEICQVIGGFWDKFQTRSFTFPQRPVDL
ncbi:SPT48 protein, partial [Fregata magnificens]|nr:SPT48 protein [Fregata magnificens]